MSYQVEDPAFAQQDYNNMLTERGSTAISPMGSQWGNYALAMRRSSIPITPPPSFDQLFAASDPVATDVTYAGATYYQTIPSANSAPSSGTCTWMSPPAPSITTPTPPNTVSSPTIPNPPSKSPPSIATTVSSPHDVAAVHIGESILAGHQRRHSHHQHRDIHWFNPACKSVGPLR